jgi:Mor family transcriptional regulator
MAIFIDDTGNIFHENSKTGAVIDTGEVDNRIRTKFLCSILTDLTKVFSKNLKAEPIQKIGKQKVSQR